MTETASEDGAHAVTDRNGGLRDRLSIGLMCFAAIVYMSVVGEILAGRPLDIRASYLSELAARQQSTGQWFRLADLVSSAVVVVATTLLISIRGRWRTWRLSQRLLAIGLYAFGVATIIDSTLTPLDCAISLPECRAQIAAGTMGQTEWQHNVSSGTAGVGIALFAASLLLITVRSWRMCEKRILLACVIAAMVVLLLSLALLVVSEAFGFAPLGIVQRVQVALSCLAIALAPLPLVMRSRKCG